VSATQLETFSPKNITVLGVLLLLAVFVGEVLIGPAHEGEMAVEAVDTMEDIAMRIRPVVTLDDVRSPKAASAAGGAMAASSSDASASMSPEQLYQAACLACHTTGAAGAPKIGDAAAWVERAQQGIDTLVTHAVNGIGAMPPRGGSQLGDDQIRAVVEYILDNSK